jgi:hypothetical protein
VPRKNLFKIGVATAAAAVGAVLAFMSVFAHSTTTTGTSLVGSIVGHANSLGIPADFTIRNMAIAEQEQDAQEAAELAAKIAAAQQALAAKQAALAAQQAAEAAEATETDEDAVEVEQADTDDQTAPQTTAVNADHEGSGDQGGD